MPKISPMLCSDFTLKWCDTDRHFFVTFEHDSMASTESFLVHFSAGGLTPASCGALSLQGKKIDFWKQKYWLFHTREFLIILSSRKTCDRLSFSRNVGEFLPAVKRHGLGMGIIEPGKKAIGILSIGTWNINSGIYVQLVLARWRLPKL